MIFIPKPGVSDILENMFETIWDVTNKKFNC